MIIKLLIEGGNMVPGPAIAQKIGPLGINMGKVIQGVNTETKEFKGLKVPVELDINPKTKDFKIKVFSPPTSELLKKEIGVEKGTGDHKKLKVGNLSIEQIIKIAKIKKTNMLDRELKSAVRSVVGSCVALGVLIENEEPKKIEQDILSGKYDKEIKQEITETDIKKAEQLKSHFEAVRKAQEAAIKKAEEEKLAAEAQAEAAAAAAPAAAAPAKESSKEAGKTAVAAPAEAKKEPAKPKK